MSEPNQADPSEAETATTSDVRTTVADVELVHATTGAGPDLIWGHGLTSSRANEDEAPLIDWRRVPARVTRYDARGHGRSEATPELAAYRWAALAADQLALADALGVGSYVAGGASMGCATALHAAVAAPDRIDRLVLVIPPTAWETRAAQVDQYRATAHVVATRGVEPVIEAGAAVAPPDPYVGDTERPKRRAAYLRAYDPDRLALVFRGAAEADFPARESVAALTQPALILAWTGDAAHPASTATELHRLLPDSTLHLASTADDLATWTDRVTDFVEA